MNRFALQLFVIALLAGGTVRAQPALPDTPAGRYLADFLEVYHRADPVALRRFALARLHPDLLAGLGGLDGALSALAGIQLEFGPIELVDVREESPHRLTAYTRGVHTRSWLAIGITIDAAPSARVTNQTMEPWAAPPGTEPLGPLADEEFATILGAYLDESSAHDLFSGVVLVARDGEIVFQGAYGRRNEDGDPVTLDTRFALASMSKMFTALAVARAVEEGRLSFADPVLDHLPDVPAALSARLVGVSVHHLLSHTSGLGGFDFGQIRGMTTVLEMLTLETESTPFAPGERFAYSNMGYVLLGAIIERVGGKDFVSYLREHVLEPLGMNDTGALPLDETTPDYATGFVADVAAWLESGELVRVSNRDTRVRMASPAGDHLATGPDLLRFAAGLRRHIVVGADMLEIMTTPKAANYGYGFQTFPNGMVGHSGGARGESTHLAMDLGSGLTVVVLSNYDRAAGPVVRFIDDLLGHPLP